MAKSQYDDEGNLQLTQSDGSLPDVSEREPETQFQAHTDDEDVLWEVLEITAENARQYKVKWEGKDEKGRPWAQSWVPKHDCTDELVIEWKLKKAKQRRASGTYTPFLLSLSCMQFLDCMYALLIFREIPHVERDGASAVHERRHILHRHQPARAQIHRLGIYLCREAQAALALPRPIRRKRRRRRRRAARAARLARQAAPHA